MVEILGSNFGGYVVNLAAHSTNPISTTLFRTLHHSPPPVAIFVAAAHFPARTTSLSPSRSPPLVAAPHPTATVVARGWPAHHRPTPAPIPPRCRRRLQEYCHAIVSKAIHYRRVLQQRRPLATQIKTPMTSTRRLRSTWTLGIVIHGDAYFISSLSASYLGFLI